MTAKKSNNPVGPVLRKPAAMAYTGLGQTAFDELIFSGELPPPIRISDGGRSVAWIKKELDDWLASRIAKRDADQLEAERKAIAKASRSRARVKV